MDKDKIRSDNASCITIYPGSQIMTIHHPQNSDKSAIIILSPQAQGTEIRDIVQWESLVTGNVIEVEKALDGNGFKVAID